MTDDDPEDGSDGPAAAPGRPVVRLRPKAGRRFAEGAPWVYADEVAMDRRTRALAPGALARLEGPAREGLGTVAVNGASTIALRLLDEDPEAEIDAAWFARRLTRALALREAFFDAPYYRLAHAEADGLPGVVIDRFGDAVAVQPNAAWAELRLWALVEALEAVIAPKVIVKNAGSRARVAEGLDGETAVLKGALAGPVAVPMNGAIYMADLTGGQKTGLFYDQRPNHAAAAGLARGRAVLDVFAHVGGFSLATLAAGAASALAVDSSAPALALAEEGARRMGVADRFATLKADAFEAMRRLTAEERRFGMAVCDPPAFAPSRSAVEAGLRAYEKTARLGAGLVERDGWLVLCSCSHAVDAEAFAQACARGIRAAGRSGALALSGRAGPDHPVHMALPETAYLKALVWRLD
jgi:23S rRNA (cytosine1962-C5)-methyltransferase